MKKNKLFITISIITFVFISGMAATCNFCGIKPTEETTSTESFEAEYESAQEEGERTTTEETEVAEKPVAEEPAEESVAEEPAEEPVAEEPAEEESIEEVEPAGEAGPSEGVRSMLPESSMSGYILNESTPVITKNLRVVRMGDSDTNKQYKGYLTWDIADLHGTTVIDAEVNFYGMEEYNDPSFAQYLDVKFFLYGNLDATDFAIGGVSLARIPVSLTSYSISGDTLNNELQKVLDNPEQDYFQLKLGLSSASDNDGVSDCIFVFKDQSELIVDYLD